ncbi:MAG: hypothetical protein AAF763_10225 [Pseudomonadota bacterium]
MERDEREPRDKRVPFMLSQRELEAVDDWAFSHRVRQRSEAIRRLLSIGRTFSAPPDWVETAQHAYYERLRAAREAIIADLFKD